MSRLTHIPDAAHVQSVRERIADAGPVLVKVGSNVLVGKSDGIVNRQVFTGLVAAIARVKQRHKRHVVLVSSGAVAVGRRSTRRPIEAQTTNIKQALAAIGQPILMHLFATEFGFYDLRAAQVLLSPEDLGERDRFLHARHTLRQLEALGDVIPVINENDTVATDELKFGDNDRLAALTTNVAGAPTLLILSDVDGLYTANPAEDPSAVRIEAAYADDEALDAMVGDGRSSYGTGGMASKLAAARIAAASGVTTIIAPGRQPGVIEAICEGQPVGTLLLPREETLGSRKAWLRYAGVPSGTLRVDAGAVQALRNGASLLPIGLVAVDGAFKDGELVAIAGPSGEVVAQGLSSYADHDMRTLCGVRSDEIRARLGYSYGDAVVHRDDLILV